MCAWLRAPGRATIIYSLSPPPLGSSGPVSWRCGWCQSLQAPELKAAALPLMANQTKIKDWPANSITLLTSAIDQSALLTPAAKRWNKKGPHSLWSSEEAQEKSFYLCSRYSWVFMAEMRRVSKKFLASNQKFFIHDWENFLPPSLTRASPQLHPARNSPRRVGSFFKKGGFLSCQV